MDQPILPFTNQYKKYSQSIMPFIENQQTKNYSTVIFFFLVLSVFGWYAIRPTVQTILYLQREIKDKTETNKKMDVKISALIEANSAYENAKPLLPVLSEAIPKNPDALDLANQIQNLAAEKNITLSSLQMSNVPLISSSASANTKSAKNAELPIAFDIQGSYSSVVAFLRDLIAMRRLVIIKSLNFSPFKGTTISASESAKPSSIQVSINMLGYYETK